MRNVTPGEFPAFAAGFMDGAPAPKRRQGRSGIPGSDQGASLVSLEADAQLAMAMQASLRENGPQLPRGLLGEVERPVAPASAPPPDPRIAEGAEVKEAYKKRLDEFRAAPLPGVEEPLLTCQVTLALLYRLAEEAPGPEDVADIRAAFASIMAEGPFDNDAAYNRLRACFATLQEIPSVVVPVLNTPAAAPTTVALDKFLLHLTREVFERVLVVVDSPALNDTPVAAMYMWLALKFLEFARKLAPLNGYAICAIAKLLLNRMSIALEPTSLGTVLAILAERGENGLHDALLDVLANVLTSNVDLLTVRYRVFKAHRLPGIARILRLVVPDNKRKPAFQWTTLMSKLLGTDLNGLLDPFESTFEETLHALFDAIVVEAGRDEVPPDLLKLGLQGLHDRKEKLTWANWTYIVRVCQERFPATHPIQHIAQFIPSQAEHIVSTCPEESLVGIPAFLHAQSTQRELAAPLGMIVGGLLPKLFQDTRCSGTVFSYIIRHGLHLAPSVFAPELTSALTKLPSDCSFIPTVMLSAVLSPEEAEKVRTQYLMHHPAEEATAAERDLTLPAVGGGPVLLFGLDRASEFLTKTGHNYMEAKRALQEAKRASGRAVGARSEDFRGPIDVDMDDDFEFDIDQRDRGGAGAGMPSNVFGGFNVREIARRVDALASQPGAEGKTAEGSPVVDEEPPGLSISDLASAFAKLFSLASPSMHGTLFLRGLYALDHHPMFFRQGSSNKVKAAREFLGQLPLPSDACLQEESVAAAMKNTFRSVVVNRFHGFGREDILSPHSVCVALGDPTANAWFPFILKSLKDTVLEHANSQGYFLTEMFRNMMTELPANVAAPFKLGATAEFLSSFVSFVVDTLSLPPDEENPASELNAFRLKFDVYMTDVGWPSLLDRYEEGAVNSGLSRLLSGRQVFMDQLQSPVEISRKCLEYVIRSGSSFSPHALVTTALRVSTDMQQALANPREPQFMASWSSPFGLARPLHPQAKIVQYLLRFNIGDVRSVFDKALVGVPRTPANDWLWDPSMVVSTVLDNSRHDNLTFSNVKAMVATLSAVLTPLADVDKFLSYFISLPQPSTVFRKYMDQQLGRGVESEHTKHLSIVDGSLLREIQAVRSRLRVLARADVIPKAELELIAKILTNSNVSEDIKVLNQFYREGGAVAGGECRLDSDTRLDVLRRVIRQLQVLALINDMTTGLEKHDLKDLMQQDAFLKRLASLKEEHDADPRSVMWPTCLTQLTTDLAAANVQLPTALEAEINKLVSSPKSAGTFAVAYPKLVSLAERLKDPMPRSLTQLKTDLEKDSETVTLTQVKPDDPQIAIFQTLTATQMQLLRQCGKYADYKRWLKLEGFFDTGDSKEGTERFNKMINHVTSLLQGESYDEEVLTALMETRPHMTLFLSPPSLTRLVESVGSLDLPSLQSLDLVEKNLSQIQDWFEDNVAHTFGEVMSQLDAIMAGGKAVIHTPIRNGVRANTVILEIRFSVSKNSRLVSRVLTEDQLADFAQAVIFHASDRDSAPAAAEGGVAGGHDEHKMTDDYDDPSAAAATVFSPTRKAVVQTKQHANVPDFLRAIKMLRQMRVVAAQLYSEVHVMALDEDKPLPVSDLEGNEATLASLEQSLQVHRAELTAIRQRHPLLSFLLLPQVLRLLEVVQACQNMYVATDGDALVEIPPETRQEMLMFLAYCGLDAARVVMTRDCFGASPFHEDKIELAHIERLGSWLETVKNLPNCASLLVPAAKSLPDIGRAKGNVAVFALDAIDSTPVDIYTRISAVYRSAAPHWSQVLWCGPSTTQAQLTTFYERCERNTDVVFVMVAPNTLPRELWDLVQEGMLGLIHGSGPMTASEPTTAAGGAGGPGSAMVDDEDEGPRARGPRGRLAIIFTKDCAMRRLCVNALATPRSSSPRFDLRFARAGFKIFLGRSGDGKSFNLNNELRLPTMSGRHVITVRVNEGFTLEGLVQRLGGKGGILTPLSQDTPLTFVFHVSAYAPFDEFDAFLFQLFVSGALSSFTSGTVVALPPSADVQVLIEVPNPVPTHDGAADARKAPKMKRSASNDGVNFTEGTVGDASASAPSEAGPAKPAVSKHCPCVDCLRVVNLGVPYEEMHGCKHMIPTLQCLSPEERLISPDVPFCQTERFGLALRMLRAYVMPLGQLTRPSWNNKITKIDGCGPRCPPAGRFVIDAVAISNDRPREPVDLKLTERIEVEVKKLLTKVDAKRDETEYRVVFNSPKLEVVDVMAFFKEELAPHFDPGALDSVTASKRQMTFFLSYMARVAAFWEASDGLSRNVFDLHQGSVLFEAMIMRGLDLCNKTLRGNWRTFPHQFLILLDGEMQLLSSYNAEGFKSATGETIFRKGKRGQLLPDVEGGSLGSVFKDAATVTLAGSGKVQVEQKALFVHKTVMKIKAPRSEDLKGDSDVLKQQLAVALDVNLAKLVETLAAHKYILTFDFLMKMLHIRERRRALVPTIIEGETGVGKTKLLTVYAAIESMSFANNFNVLAAFRLALLSGLSTATSEHVRKFRDRKLEELHAHPLTIPRMLRALTQAVHEVRKHEALLLPKLLGAIKGVMLGPLFHHPLFNPTQLQFFMRTMLEDPKTEARADFGGDTSHVMTTEKYRSFHCQPLDNAVRSLRSMWSLASDHKSSAFAHLYEKSDEDILSSLSYSTKTLFNQIAEETKTKVKKPDEVVDEEEVFVLNGQAAFARWCLAWMLVQPVSMFHTILMTAAYTVDDLRRELLPVIRFASRVQACFSLEGVQTALVVAKKEECTEDIAKQAMDVIGGHYRQGDVAADATPSFVVFLDEVNTSSILGSVQDVMLDNSLEGEPLPHNIFWVCATNPFRAETAVIDQHSAASGDVGFRAHYQVRPVPEAMELVKWQFGALTSEAELDYITAKMRELCSVPDAGTAVGGAGAPALDPVAPSAPVYDEYLASPSDHCGLCEKQPIHWTCTACDSSAGSQTLPTELRPFVAVRSLADTVAVSNNIGLDLNWTNVPLRPSPDDMRLMTDVINTAHSFVKRTEGDSSVSQRDLQRVFKALRFFWNHLLRRDVQNSIRLEDPMEKSKLMLHAVFLASGLVYFLRLSEDARSRMDAELLALTADTHCGPLSLTAVMDAETRLYIDNVKLEEGIAENKALKENVFAIIVCIQLRTPLIIVGPPGSSKTLSFQIVQANVLNDPNVRDRTGVAGGGSSGNPPFFSGFLSVEAGVFHYQCSEHSTSNELKTVFERAIQRQTAWDNNHSKSDDMSMGSLRRTAVVFMDEAGLPEEAKESLKVLHYYLDDPQVAFVAITNRPLDAAKMNRAVVLFRPAADKQELGLLLAGSLGEGPALAGNSVVCAFRDAYHSLMAKQTPLVPGGIVFRERYGLRDFYNFGRYFARASRGGSLRFPPTDTDTLRSLERNFNGVTRPEFEAITEAFFAELEKIDSGDTSRGRRLSTLRYRSVIDVLREALADRNTDALRMNETIVRYQLVLDDTEDDSAARLLFQSGILDRSQTVVYDLSDFPADRNDVVRSTLISNIKHAMMKGKTLFLMHTAPIHGSLYDLLNQHFSRMEKRDGAVLYYANVAVGSYSRPCQVHPNFRLIVHLPTWMKAPAPFYNRFEKYLVTVTSMWEDLLNHHRLKEAERLGLRQIQLAVDKLVSVHFNSKGFIGFVQDSTIASVMLSKTTELANRQRAVRRLNSLLAAVAESSATKALEEWKSFGLGKDDHSSLDAEPLLGPGSFYHDKLVMDIASTVLQIVTPETILEFKNSLPHQLTRQYLNEQEHFDLSRVLLQTTTPLSRASNGPQSSTADAIRGVDFGAALDATQYSPLKKTVAFTRLAEGLDDLCDTPPTGSVDIPHPSYKGKCVAIMNFAEVMTQETCEAFINDFAAESNPCQSLLVLVDIRSVGSRRLNSLRQIIDDRSELLKHNHIVRLSEAAASAVTPAPSSPSSSSVMAVKAAIESVRPQPQKHVVVCVLIPPTWIGSRAAYPALFLNGWDFTYLDSHSEALGSISAGSWMRVACGLQTGFTPDCAAALKGLNKAMLKTVALAVTGKRGAHHFLEISGHDQDAKADFVAMEPFYMDPISGFATTADRVSVLEQLESVMGGQTLCSLMAHRFLALFSESDINKQLMIAAAQCSSGQSTGGLTSELNIALQSLYERFACELYHKAAAGYTLQSLYHMYKHHGASMMAALHSFTRSALEDLCAPCLKSASDLPPPSPRSVSHERVWEWHPLPFLAHIKAAVVGDIASLRARSPDGAIDSAGRSTLRSALATAFRGLMRGGVLLGDAPEPIRSFFTGLLLQSIARLIGGSAAVVYTTLAQTGATERFAMTYLSRCVRSHADVATILVFDCSSRRRPLQKQLYAIAKLEQAGLVSGRDVAEATEGLDFAEYAEEEDDPRNHEVYEQNSAELLRGLWNLLVVRLWVGLCNTFDAVAEVKAVAEAGLSLDAGPKKVSPGEWCTFAGDAVQVLEPVRKAVSDAGLTPVHKVVMESLKVVTPLVALLFPGGKSAKAKDPARHKCVSALLPVIREQATALLNADTDDKLLHLRMVEGALSLLPGLRSSLPDEKQTLDEFIERVFTDGCARLAANFRDQMQGVNAPALVSDFKVGFAPDLKFALRVLNGRDTCDVGFPEAFRVRILTDIYTSIIEAHRDVRDSLLAWFREAVTAEMDAAGLDERGAPQALPSRFADVLFVPDWFLNAKQLGAAQEFVSHPCLMCPLARALFWVLLKQRIPTGTLPGTALQAEVASVSRLTPALTAKVNKVNRLANCGWYTCIEFAIADTAMLEALAGDMAAPRIPDGPAARSHRTPAKIETLTSLSRLVRDRAYKEPLDDFMGRLQTSFPAQLYLISRVSGLYGKEHVCRVLHAPRNVTLLTTVRGVKPDKTWLEPFQIIYPPERSEDDPVDADVVKASLTGADFLSMLPFMWPRPVKDMQEGHPETPQEKEESKAYSAFYAETVSAFIAANRAFLEGGGSRACKAALAPWLEYLRATVGGSGDPDAPPRLRCKMFLFCVLAWVWFGRDTPQDRRCHALCESLDAIAAILKLDDRETRLFAAFADPQAFYDCDTGRRDDITINFFKSEARVQEDKRQRAVILGMIANVLGMPRGSHVFHTHLFNPSKLSGTCGLGSAYTNTIGTVHYDCGTILQPDTGVWERGWREPLTDKGVLASLYIPTFGIVAVGLLLFPEEHAGSYGPVFSRFYNTASDNWGRGTSAKARDEKDWLINFVNSRTVAGHTVMAEHVLPSSDERTATMMYAVNSYRHVAAAHKRCCMATYPDPSLREELERLWRDQCYMRAYTNRLGIIQRLESALTQSALVAKVVMMRRALPAARHPMEGLSAAIDRLPPALQETYDCLRHLNGTTTGFWCMDLIPALVSLYDWLYDCQGHILSLDDSYVKTMGALFQELALLYQELRFQLSHRVRSSDPGRQHEARRMSDLYVTICEKWNRLNAETEGNLRVECQLVDGRQDNSQKFAPISFDTAVGTFLTYPDNESNDVLLKVVDFLSFRQNDFLGKFKMEERPSVPLAALSEVSLMSDISTEFSTVVGMYALNEGEAAANGNCPFLLDRILHKIQPHVMKPLIESTERSLLKKFPFRTAIVERVEDEELEATGILIESVKQTMPSVLSQAVIEGAEREALLQRLSVLGARSEKLAIEFLMHIARQCMQITESIVAEVKRARAAQLSRSVDLPTEDAVAEITRDVHTRVKTDFHLEEPIEVFASRHGLSPGITDHAELLLCRNVLFAQPMRLLAALLDLLSTRMLSHANLFTRFPPYMKTPMPASVVDEMWQRVRIQFNGDIQLELQTLSKLQEILEDKQLEESVVGNATADQHCIRDYLTLLSYLDEDDPVESSIVAILPDGILTKSHYADLLQTVYCRCVKLRVSEKQLARQSLPSVGLWNPNESFDIATRGAAATTATIAATSRALPSKREAMTWSPSDVCRFLTTHLRLPGHIVDKIGQVTGTSFLKYDAMDLRDAGLSDVDTEAVTAAIDAILRS